MHRLLIAAAAALALPCSHTAVSTQDLQIATITNASLMAPLGGVWLEDVTLDDGSVAKVSVPLGARTPRPVIVGVHGMGDRPEWSCGEWRGVTDAYSFVVCPHGTPAGNAYVWTSIGEAERRALEAAAAVKKKYGAYVMDGPAIYAGFSQGAHMGPYVVRKHGDVFPLMALDEGGYVQTAGDFGATFAKTGGKRALLACSTPSCERRFTTSEKLLGRSGVDVRVAKLGNFGHTMDPHVTSGLREQFKWLVRDDPRWQPWISSSSSPKN